MQGALQRAYDLHLTKDGNYPGLALPLAQLTGGRSPAIQAYFNAADVDTGLITSFSNVDEASKPKKVAGVETPPPITVGQPMLHSARFPLVSPAGAFMSDDNFEHRLVDGGYIDNSGADTLRRTIPQKKARDEDESTKHCWIVLDGNQEEFPATNQDGSKVSYPPMLTSLRALLQARTGNAKRAVDDLASSSGLPKNLHTLVVGEDDHAPALGWYLSAAAAKTLEASSRASAESIVKAWRPGSCALL